MPESISDKKMNKGEWAEFYTMLKLLGEGKLYTANNLLQKDYNNYLDVLKIIREEIKSHVLEYIIDERNHTVSVMERNTGNILSIASQDEYVHIANLLFKDMMHKTGRSIAVDGDVCTFAQFIYVSKPKAPAVEALAQQFGGKNDIFIEVRDSHTSIVSVMGFSIKSRFSHNPTLFNAGTSSQFLFKLKNCDDSVMEYFNAISDNRGRGWGLCMDFLRKKDMQPTFVRTQNPVYADNMMLIRDSMPDIMAWCVKDRLISPSTDYRVKETTERMAAENPLGISNPAVFYEKVMKDFLMASFTGMTASRVWDGREQVNGGYIVVMEDGTILCYHSSDREAFRDYLYKNTRFEYVSTAKHKWGYIKKEKDGYYLPLNISVRFNTDTR